MGNQPAKHSGRPKKAVHWKSAEPPSPPGKPMLVPGSPNSSLPDVVTLRWKRPTSDGGSPILGYIVEHRRTGSPHWVRASAVLTQATEMSFSGLEPGWRYQFRVLAQNIVGQSETSELSDALTVTLQRAAEAPPRFIYELLDTTAIENEKVEFRVSVAGTPAPQISWYKDGFEMFSSRRTKILTEGDFSVLVIHQAALTDAGEIKCTATNRAGHTITQCNLVIDAYPKIRLPRQYEDGLIIEADEVIRLKVGIAGQPTPIVEWSHNGELITSGGRYEIETTDKNSSLRIANAQRSDRGEYNLRAFNKLGEDYASFLVTVTARPESPGKVSISVGIGKTVTLSWTAPDDDGGCKIGNYIVEYYRVGWDVWLKATTCRQLNTTLSGLFEGSQYRFRVKAENPYGLSEPSEESDILFIPDPKRGINSATQVTEMDMKENDTQPLAVPRKRREESRSPARDIDQIKRIRALTADTGAYSQNEFVREMSYGTRDEDFFKPKPADTVRKTSPAPALAPAPAPAQPVKIESKIKEPAKPVESPPPNNHSYSPPSAAFKPSSQPALRKSKSPSPAPLLPAVIITAPAASNITTPPEPSYPPPQRPPQAFSSPLKAMEKFSKDPSPLSNIAFASNQLETTTNAATAAGATSPVSSTAGNPSIHNSSEFMLVLYNDQEAKNNTRNSTFDFELDDMVPPPPPLSLSAPELNVEPPPAPSMRPAVSSTELLYERAMARFYQAVALEESENQRKAIGRRQSYGAAEQQLQQQQLLLQQQQQQLQIQQQQLQQQQQELTAAAVSARLADRRSSLRRRLSGDKETIVKQSSFETDARQHSSTIEEVIPEEKSVPAEPEPVIIEQPIEEHDEEMSISSSMDSMLEELKRREANRSSRSRGMSDDEEMETYHPGQRVVSPYTNPDPSQAIEVLTKPLPLPDPNFVPKPILKRPSTELLTKDDKEKKPSASKPERRSLTNIFDRKSPTKEPSQPLRSPPVEREKTPEPKVQLEIQTSELKPASSEKRSPSPAEPVSMSEKQPPSEFEIRSAIVSEVARQRRLESRQNSIEESRAVADFYTDIVQQVESAKKPRQLPFYVSPDDVRKQNRSRSRDASHDRFVRSRSGSRSPLEDTHRIQKSRSPSLTSEQIVIKGKPARESKILRQRSTSVEQDPKRPSAAAAAAVAATTAAGQPLAPKPIKPETAFNSREAGSDSIRKSRPLRESTAISKKRNVSNTRSRSSSGTRDPESILDGTTTRRSVVRDQPPPPIKAAPETPAPPKPPSIPSTPPTTQAVPTPEPRSRSQSRTREPTPQEANVKSAMAYLTDVALFGLACWLYLFKNPKLAIPVIVLIMYRHISDALRDRIPPWVKRPIS